MQLLTRLFSWTLLTACLTSAARAQDRAPTLTELGNSQWPVIAGVLGTLVVVGGALLAIGSMRLSKLRRHADHLEREIAMRSRSETILREAHEELEAKVRDRTADLEMSYQKLNDVRESLAMVNERLESVARIDDLTGVANRQQFDETIRKEIKRSLRSRKPLSLMLVELDDFLPYRRQYGRDRADTAISKAAAALEKTFRRAPDIVARYADHCFGVIMPETDARDAMRFAERLRDIVFQQCIPYPEAETTDRVTASVGLVTMQPDKLYDASEFVAAARQALEAARKAGGNTVEYGAIRVQEEPAEA